MVNHPNRKKVVPTHEIPSGMGGVFPVVIVSEEGEGVVVRVVNPQAGDWHGKEFAVRRSALREIRPVQP